METTAGAVTSTKQYIWSDDLRSEERDGTGALTKQFFDRGQKNGTTSYFYTKNHLGSITEMTDSTAAITCQLNYDPFGLAIALVNGQAPDFEYASYYLHGRSGLYLTRTRAYSASLARFITRDPAKEQGGLNLYAYVMNDPVRWTDPSGLDRSCQPRQPNPPTNGNANNSDRGSAPANGEANNPDRFGAPRTGDANNPDRATAPTNGNANAAVNVPNYGWVSPNDPRLDPNSAVFDIKLYNAYRTYISEHSQTSEWFDVQKLQRWVGDVAKGASELTRGAWKGWEDWVKTVTDPINDWWDKTFGGQQK